MNKLFLRDWWDRVSSHPFIRRWVLNKYAITLIIFAVIFTFVGDKSIVHIIQRSHKERVLRRQLQQSRQNIVEYERALQNLSHPDSLERFAREQYHMHAPNEDVYVTKKAAAH